MPVVTKLTSQKRGEFVNLYVDDEFFCGLSLNQVAAHRLHKGQELSVDELEALRHEANLSKAYHLAIRYVALRIRSEKEMYDYLKRKDYVIEAPAVIERLKSERYLNDEDFAERWAAMRREQHRSPRAILSELSQKGIRVHADQLNVSTPEQTQDSLQALIKKKTRHRDYEREKVMSYLAGKGFSYTDIKSALDVFEETL